MFRFWSVIYNTSQFYLRIKSQGPMRPRIKKYHEISFESVENFIIKEGSSTIWKMIFGKKGLLVIWVKVLVRMRANSILLMRLSDRKNDTLCGWCPNFLVLQTFCQLYLEFFNFLYNSYLPARGSLNLLVNFVEVGLRNGHWQAIKGPIKMFCRECEVALVAIKY